MAIEKGVTEVADSEDDPMTSSPGVVPDGAADKLCAMSCVPNQERQDALHETDGLHQALAERDASAVKTLDANRDDASVDVDASKTDQSNTTSHDPTAVREEEEEGEGTVIEGCSHNLGLHSQMHLSKPVSTTRDMRYGPDVKAVEAAVGKDAECDFTACGRVQQSTAGEINPVLTEQESTRSMHLTTVDAQSQAPLDTGHDSSDTSVDSEARRESACRWQDGATCDSMLQETTDNFGQAAERTSADKHSSENVVNTIIPQALKAVSTETNAKGVAATLLEDAMAKVLESSLSPAAITQDDCTSSQHREAQDPGETLQKIQVAIDTSESAMDVKEPSSMIDRDQASREKLPEQHTAVQEVELSKESADRSIDASSTTAESTIHAHPHADTQHLLSPTQTPPSKTPQEITLDALKAQKIALLASLGALPAIQVFMEENALSDTESGDASDERTEIDIMAAANKIVKEHIKLLHEYNELKDVGQGLMGLIADQRGVRIVEVQEEFGIDAQD